MFKCNTCEFVRHYIAVYGTWIHHYKPGTKSESTKSAFPDGRAPKKKIYDPRGTILTLFRDGKDTHGTVYC